MAGSWPYSNLHKEIADLQDSVPALRHQQTAQGKVTEA